MEIPNEEAKLFIKHILFENILFWKLLQGLQYDANLKHFVNKRTKTNKLIMLCLFTHNT